MVPLNKSRNNPAFALFKMYYSVVLLLLCANMVQIRPEVTSDQCSRKSMNGLVLECRGLRQVDDSVFDGLLSNDTAILLLRNCQKVHLDGRALANRATYRNIKNLQIVHSEEELYLAPKVLSVFSNLKVLKINMNRWSEIGGRTFEGLDKLENLDLAANDIRILSSDSFRGLKNLQVLDLSHNDLSDLPSHVFQPLGNLETLDLSNNALKAVDLTGLDQLVKLDLAHNGLTDIRAEAFNGLTKLSVLNLQENRISAISGGFRLAHLKFLSLADNRLGLVPRELFRGCAKLMSIDLSGNSLDDLSESAFLDLPDLKHLTLRGNGRVAREGFKTLKERVLVTF